MCELVGRGKRSVSDEKYFLVQSWSANLKPGNTKTALYMVESFGVPAELRSEYKNPQSRLYMDTV